MEDIKVAIETAKTSNGPSSDLLTSNLTDNSKLLHTQLKIKCIVYNSIPDTQRWAGFVNDLTLSVFEHPSPPHHPHSFSSINNLLTFPECPEDSSVEAESEDDLIASHTMMEKPTPHRGNTMVHVCWHRNTSVSMVDFSIAVEVPAKAQHSASTCPSPPASLFSFSVSQSVLYLNTL